MEDCLTIVGLTKYSTMDARIIAMITSISRLLMKHMDNAVVQSIFSGIRPAVVGLLIAATLILMNRENFGTTATPWQFYISIALFLATFIGTKYIKIHPIKMILLCAFAGLMLLY